MSIEAMGIFKSWLSSHTLAGLAMCPVSILSKNKRVKTTYVVTYKSVSMIVVGNHYDE